MVTLGQRGVEQHCPAVNDRPDRPVSPASPLRIGRLLAGLVAGDHVNISTQ